MSYAFFPIAGRLAIQSNGQVSVYDTGHHQIAGVSQQQGSGGAVVFATPAGTVSLSSLTSVGGGCQQQSSGGGSQQQTSHGGQPAAEQLRRDGRDGDATHATDGYGTHGRIRELVAGGTG